MSALVLGLATAAPVAVDDAAFIDTSFPGFVGLVNGLVDGPAPIAAPAGRAPGRAAMTAGLPLIIAVDGPAAAGKGTLARRLARHFGLPYLDTGLLYRAVGRRVLDAGGDPADPAAAEAAARALRPGDLERSDLRGPPADAAASAVAAIPGVRAALLEFQRAFGRARGAVLDGRDIGTVVFPAATAKLYVTASPRGAGPAPLEGTAPRAASRPTSPPSPPRCAPATPPMRDEPRPPCGRPPTPAFWTPPK